jgi:type II secretory pathway pseudopilin PulG
MYKKRDQKNKKFTKTGFTILETLVAITILLLSITGPLVFSQNGLRASFVSRDQITAFYLAQDAIEYVKWIRNNNLLKINDEVAGTQWLDGLNDCKNNGCTIDTVSQNIHSCNPSDKDGCIDFDDNSYVPLTYDIALDDEKIYGYNRSENSIFARHILINETVQDQEAEVTVTIRWKTHETLGERQIVVKENIFNVLPN